jgi:2,4-diketo-3-deoxy-L-fuconate hydrolase
MFTKDASCLQGPDDEVRKPRLATRMDWEVEFGIVVGTRARCVDKECALDRAAAVPRCWT